MEIQTEHSKLEIGQAAPYFSLPATDGRIYSLSSFSDAQLLAVIFTSNHCPFARAYEQRMVQLAVRMAKQECALVAIGSNDAVGFPEDSFENMVACSQRLGFPFPYLRDEDQSVAQAYGALCTPEAFLFTPSRKLCYHGAIDDNYADADRVEHPYLKLAIDAALAGKQCSPELTRVVGCSIKWCELM